VQFRGFDHTFVEWLLHLLRSRDDLAVEPQTVYRYRSLNHGSFSMCNVDRGGFCLGLGALSATTSFPAFAITTLKKLANIVYTLVDDVGWGDIDAYNRFSDVPTPNANRLATEGMRFTDMHAMVTAPAITGKPLPSDAAEDSFNVLPVFLGRQLSKPIRNAIGDQAADGMLTIREGSWKRGCGPEGSVFPGMSRLHPVARRPNCITSQPILRPTQSTGLQPAQVDM
jgi:hypothetical protein